MIGMLEADRAGLLKRARVLLCGNLCAHMAEVSDCVTNPSM